MARRTRVSRVENHYALLLRLWIWASPDSCARKVANFRGFRWALAFAFRFRYSANVAATGIRSTGQRQVASNIGNANGSNQATARHDRGGEQYRNGHADARRRLRTPGCPETERQPHVGRHRQGPVRSECGAGPRTRRISGTPGIAAVQRGLIAYVDRRAPTIWRAPRWSRSARCLSLIHI